MEILLQDAAAIWDYAMRHLLIINMLLAVVVVFFQRKEPKSVWAWLLILYFLPIVGFIFYLCAGTDFYKRRKFRTKEAEDHISEAIREQEHGIRQREITAKDEMPEGYSDLVYYNMESAGASLTGDNRIDFYTDGNEKFDALIGDMEAAQDFIHIQYYIIKNDVREFKGMDGKFRDNVILQSKNGPLDFQPREPYAPIFDNIKQTPQIAELQITQEYLGQSKHLTYLAPMWKEFFDFVNPNKLVGISGVANIGDDANWCGHPFSQANWYAFGRLAWNPSLTAEEIAHEWLVQTYENQDEKFTKPVEMMMMTSREACVNYMMPLGLHHIFKFDHHYGPEPDGFIASYPLEWCPVYYHKADAQGVGFDRSSKGTDAVGQYPEPYRSLYDNIETCPEEYLLWFHHVAWDYKMKSGSTLWQELCMKYNMGVAMVEVYRDFWHTSAKQYMKGHEQEWQHTDSLLNVQLENAKEWRNTCLKYFQTFSKMKIYE